MLCVILHAALMRLPTRYKFWMSFNYIVPVSKTCWHNSFGVDGSITAHAFFEIYMIIFEKITA